MAKLLAGELYRAQKLFNTNTSTLVPGTSVYSGHLNLETPGDSKKAFLHCGYVSGRLHDESHALKQIHVVTAFRGDVACAQHLQSKDPQDMSTMPSLGFVYYSVQGTEILKV